jgi:hypothetical protein
VFDQRFVIPKATRYSVSTLSDSLVPPFLLVRIDAPHKDFKNTTLDEASSMSKIRD